MDTVIIIGLYFVLYLYTSYIYYINKYYWNAKFFKYIIAAFKLFILRNSTISFKYIDK